MEPQNLRPPVAQGAWKKLAADYANESRPASARALEQRLEALFDDDEVPRSLLDSVVCHRSVCKLRLRWDAFSTVGCLVLRGRLLSLFDPQTAIAPAQPAAAEGTYWLELYVRTPAS